jgi:hypothetical protein
MTNEHHPSDSDKQTGGVHIGDILGSIRGSIIAGRDVILGTTEQQRAMRNRRAMLELVRNTWIKGVLEQSLHGAAMIELGMEERADAVEHPWDIVVRMPNRKDRELPPGTKIIDVFDEANGSLLILGEPGSGKTTMLLDLARDVIARAEEDPTQPIPVVLNLSSWAEKYQSLDEWLVEGFNNRYDIPERIARPWIENDDLLLLLDGLDEVDQEYREACVRAINAFRQEHMSFLVICSRVAAYQTLSNRLELRQAVFMQPLVDQQIYAYLDRAGADLAPVRQALNRDPNLQALVKTPLMLSVIMIAYRGASTTDLPSDKSIKAYRRRVFEAYIDRMFNRIAGTDRKLHSEEKTLGWLTWLAQNMEKRSRSIFLIEEMQPDLLQEGPERQLYSRYVTCTMRFLLFLSFSLILLTLSVHQIFWLAGGFLTILIIGWRAIGDLGQMKIQCVELLSWSWKNAINALIVGMLIGRIAMWIFGLAAGATVGRIISLMVVLMSGLFGGLRPRGVPEKTIPNQGIRQSGRNAVVFLTIALTGGLIVGMFGGLISGLVLGFVLGLFSGLVFGGLAFIQHVFLRFCLYRNNHIPWRLTSFLDYATDLIFLRKVGGGYIFIHPLLQEYFASLYEEEAA